jgi:hypothetical protein
MKKITLLLLFSISINAQSKEDLIRRAGHSERQGLLKKGNEKLNTDQKAFIAYRIATLETVVSLTYDQKYTAVKIFNEQYTLLQEPYERYISTKSPASKVDLMKVIVKNEEELREFLTPEQKLSYLKYGDKISVPVEFDDNFMSDSVLADYKKELK